MQIVPGVTGWVSQPTTYTMHYLNGNGTYTERFAVIQCDAHYVAAMGGALAPVLHAVSGALAAIPAVGNVLAGILQFGAKWYGRASLNPDGSCTFEFAYHYAGTKAGGIDLTAVPIPGVNPNFWNGAVDTLMHGISMLNQMSDVAIAAMEAPVEFAVEVTPVQVEGNPTDQ
jgi:hypothetical protein